ncbi:alpha N-terminal protein methyltransferase 1 [Canna indica]|uniref:Alpha N-terminal protein methyltransferase 1 n=1 Tax=Canna indica TaxID=4628 RepID=A0AAQ3QKN5_9LILI|nr:alpha N-terminal protein methyltransferase 1 [Canna indica]
MDAAGLDSEGWGFTSTSEMWREQIGTRDEGMEEDNNCRCKRYEWYQKGITYWQGFASGEPSCGGLKEVNPIRVIVSPGSGAHQVLVSIINQGVPNTNMLGTCGAPSAPFDTAKMTFILVHEYVLSVNVRRHPSVPGSKLWQIEQTIRHNNSYHVKLLRS